MRLTVMAGAVFGLIGFFIFLTTRLTTPQMALLYGDLQEEDVSRITAQLSAQGSPYELRRNGTQVFVPSAEAAQLRITMAKLGVPKSGNIGYEIFDNADALGSTNFIQNVNLVRALEGELARTIRSIDSVRSARVHLVMPKRALFSRQTQKATASIFLKMRSPGRLPNEQVLAIQHLIAAAVPGLDAERISIIDNKGSLLSRGNEQQSGPGGLAAKADERRQSYEKKLSRAIEELLEKSVGFGNVRAEVTVDMDFDQIVTNEEIFNPDGQVVRSTQTVEETSSSRDANANPPVGVATNLPDANLAGGGGSAASSNAENRTEETVNFEITKKVTSHTREGGIVKKLSVAVLVDGSYSNNEEGERVYLARNTEEMNNLAALVRTAIGFNADRGDSVEVINMKYAEGEDPEEEPLQLFFGFNKNDILRMAEILVLSIVAILVILLVVRPLLSRAFEALPAVAGAAGAAGRLLAEQAAEARAALPGPEDAPEEEDVEELIDIDRIEGRVKASSVKKVGEIVDKHPAEALSIIRTWMYQET
jgi:flagellar M-ring protein FliF